ncbi:hypothetical protein TCAL_09286 [Tigriopus californicus]|uniref:Ankyrin repeat and fibronectin type-III domain-containing protein 1 n=1 Tax=Tigriopus californicus TaxID=6832 RepID=A0A553P0E0_TIGCA|nr:ankyrin repeat and fibronectin type-III domain-containing protein 1-like [Tigriopus californicus]TRY71155.1 hypothetical protein TCAL_09286 [Tigriopus californicus]|eukprot:TCALIF_09286-PA protein Name:"Similar to ANKFN1 Ankyrin repeat and fibronectin type-III domain-containing protein 1 (Homo sapiens)" AED:0.00 eAED:0.00 QI:0/-1/0/1/-1/1/1/0/1050
MDIHFQALCSAVEHEKLEKCRAILDATPPEDLSALNADGFSPLDLAFATGNADLVHLLLTAGAREGGRFATPEGALAQYTTLLTEAKKQVEKFGQLMRATQNGQAHGAPGAAGVLSHAQLKECEKQQSLWQKRVSTLRRLRQGFEAQGRPHAPPTVEAEVVGSNCVSVRLHEPDMGGGQASFTKYKIQWSRQDSFARVEGEVVDQNVKTLTTVVDCLVEGQRYFIRASFGNPQGFGPFSAATPKSVVPSSWRGVEDRVPRIGQQFDICQDILNHFVGQDDEAYEPQKFSKRKGLRQLFTTSSAPKLQKYLISGRAYLCCILFHEDKILMTNEEVLPLMEICDQYTGNLMSEYQWFAKLGHALGDVERVRQETSKLNHTSATSFRLKLLQAVQNMQHTLGLCELGIPYHTPIHQSDGSVVFSMVSHIRQPKSLVSLSLKWVPLTKAQKVGPDSEYNSMDLIRTTIREQILFHQVSAICLSKGLYLCYIQAVSGLDSMRVMVTNTSPSILPYVKVRANPHVTCDEWAWVNKLGRIFSQTSAMQAPSPTTNFLAGEGEEGSDVQYHLLKHLKPTESQFAFGSQLEASMKRLFDTLDIPVELRGAHRLYDAEIFELSADISVILVVPSPEHVCSVADVRPPLNLEKSDLLSIPVQLFEVFHLRAYFRDLLTAFSRATLYLEFELLSAKQSLREAFSTKELEETQSYLHKLQNFHSRLEDSWKDVRWILDVLSEARRKGSECGVKFENISDWYSNQSYVPDDSRFCLSVSRQNSTISQSSAFQRSSSSVSDQAYASGSNTRSPNRPTSTKLTRTPTTRSDPLEFHLSHQNNKENEVHNFPQPVPPLAGHHNVGLTPNAMGPPSSLSSLTQSHHSTNSSISSTSDQTPSRQIPSTQPRSSSHAPAPQYENLSTSVSSGTFDPRITQGGRFANFDRPDSPEPNVLQVYAAYDTGLASGTSVKLNVTHSTTAREVIDLVIKQLNMAVILKGKEGPIYENERLKNFCLVAVIGNRERCLRDDFKPLNLQNPWKKGRLFVRMKNDLLAAIEHISRHSTML